MVADRNRDRVLQADSRDQLGANLRMLAEQDTLIGRKRSTISPEAIVNRRLAMSCKRAAMSMAY